MMHSMVRKCRSGLILSIAVLSLSACSGQQTFDYAAKGEKNLSAQTENTTKRWLSKRHLNIALHHENAGEPCQWEYVGTLLLDDEKQQVALPVGQRLLIQFNFIELSRLSSGGHHQSINKLFTAQPGAQYELVMAYDDDATYYEVFEYDANSGKRREIDLADAAQCQQV